MLAPTRELALQIGETFEALGTVIGLKTCVIVGGVDQMAQALALAKKPHVIIATPGRILQHLETTKGFALKQLQFLVLDEADRMLSLNFEEALERILAYLPKKRRTYLFSATMTSKVAKLQKASLRDPVKVAVSEHKYETVKELDQRYLFVPAKWKDCYLAFLIAEFSGNSILVFCASCATANKLRTMLRLLGYSTAALTGKMTQPKRLEALTRFKAGDRNVLLATDVASRGLDVPTVDMVINYDMPVNPKDYVHRVGRTARAGRAGRSVTLVTQYDVEQFQRIEQLIGEKLEAYPCEEAEVLTLLNRVEEATRLAAEEIRDKEGAKDEKRKRKRARQDEKTKVKGRPMELADGEEDLSMALVKKTRTSSFPRFLSFLFFDFPSLDVKKKTWKK